MKIVQTLDASERSDSFKNAVKPSHFWEWERTYCLQDPKGQIHIVAFNILDRFVLLFLCIEWIGKAYFGRDFATASLPIMSPAEFNAAIKLPAPEASDEKKPEIISDKEACELAKVGLDSMFTEATHEELRSFANQIMAEADSCNRYNIMGFHRDAFASTPLHFSLIHTLNFLLIKREIGCFWHSRCGLMYIPDPTRFSLGDYFKDKLDFTQFPPDYFKNHIDNQHKFTKLVIIADCSELHYLDDKGRLKTRLSLFDANDFKIIDDYRESLKTTSS